MSCRVYFHVDPALDVDFTFGVQVATHLKGLAEKAKLNEKHVKIAQIYKAKVASLTSERSELQERAQRMTEEVERLKSDLKHTISARARAESREDEVQNSLTAVESELQEIRGELRAVQDDLAETRDGLQSSQYELQVVRDELVTSRGELWESKEELRATNDELRAKVALLDGARREASKAVVLAERLSEECRRLRGDLHQQISLVTQRDEVIGKLREQGSIHGPRDGLLFSRRPLTRIQAWTSTSISQVTRRQRNLFLQIILKNQVLLLKPSPPLPRQFRLLTPKSLYSSLPARPRLLYFSSRVYLFVCFFFFVVRPGA